MYKFGVISYSLGGLLFLALTSLLITSWRGRLRGTLLLTACAVNALWCFVLAYATLNARLPNLLTFVAEVLRDTAWILFLLHFLFGADGKTSSRKFKFTLNALLIGGFCMGLYWEQRTGARKLSIQLLTTKPSGMLCWFCRLCWLFHS